MAGPKKSTALARLAPNLIEIKNDDGSVMQVPTNMEENKILNMVLAARVRAFFESALKKYIDGDSQPSPKDLKDIAEAFNKIAEGSGAIYATGADDILTPTVSKKDPIVVAGNEEVSFDSLKPAKPSP